MILTSSHVRAQSARVTDKKVIGIGVPELHGAQPPRGFFCAYRSCKPLRQAGRGHLRVGRFRVSGTPTPFRPATPIGVVMAGFNPLYTEAIMACTNTPAPGMQQIAFELLEQIDTNLYHLQHICALLGTFAGQHGNSRFTDGVQLEHYAATFGWIADQVRGTRTVLNATRKEDL